MENKVLIVGAGIAGLSAGCYAAKSGFDVIIIESHSIAGGNCTSWGRGKYLFEGGMNWLTGSSSKKAINKLWRFIGALDDSVEISTPEPFCEYIHNGESIKLFRDVNETERHWLNISPEDAGQIKVVTDNIRKVQEQQMPEFPAETYNEFLAKFKHEGIRNLIRSGTSESLGVAPLYFSMGIIGTGDGGFPAGGSLPFVKRIVDKFESLGGKIIYNTRVEKIIMENGKAAGVIAGGKKFNADAVIATSDTMAADRLFDAPLSSGWLDKMRKITAPTMN
ncbi:MAG: FAD-dependent oxidoreductase, partial [Clostridiales bacterium]|nr:FAD-dependent oxidoreductase [Clostridiales bacterium]